MISMQIYQRRLEKKLSLTELARLAHVSKGYLSQLESRSNAISPSADILARIAFALDTTVEVLLSKPSLYHPPTLPPGLREFALAVHLEIEEMQMLAGIHYQGKQPQTKEDWWFLYECIKRAVRT